MNRSQILKTPNRDDAFQAIAVLDISSRQKSSLRYAWKKRNDPAAIKTRPQKARKNKDDDKNPNKTTRKKKKNDDNQQPPQAPPTHAETIRQLQEQIHRLQQQLAALLEISRSADDICPICQKDPEGYDLPCRHSICHDCFLHRLVDGKIQCTLCAKNFEFENLE